MYSHCCSIVPMLGRPSGLRLTRLADAMCIANGSCSVSCAAVPLLGVGAARLAGVLRADAIAAILLAWDNARAPVVECREAMM
jgi:hypothetical protein